MGDPFGPRDESRPAAAKGSSALGAARLRTRAVRGGIVKIALGTFFLIGALAHALSPERHERSSRLWMTTLLFLSTLNVAWGLRAVTRARISRGSPWILAVIAWSLLALVLLGLLLRR